MEPRERAIEVMAQSAFERAADWIHGGRHYANQCAIGNCEQRAHVMCRELAAEMLDALVAATQDEPCATCGGTGNKPPEFGEYPVAGFEERCKKCDGSGRVPGPPLVLLGPRPLRDTEDDYATINKAFDGDRHRWTGDPLPLYRSQRETQSNARSGTMSGQQ